MKEFAKMCAGVVCGAFITAFAFAEGIQFSNKLHNLFTKKKEEA